MWLEAGSTSADVSESPEVGTSDQLDPELAEYCHRPWPAVAELPTTATACRDDAVGPSALLSKLGRKRDLTEAPVGADASSSMAARVEVPVATGASLTLLTVMVTVLESVRAPPVPVLPRSEVVMLRLDEPLKLSVGV